jgi:hypothetical protein
MKETEFITDRQIYERVIQQAVLLRLPGVRRRREAQCLALKRRGPTCGAVHEDGATQAGPANEPGEWISGLGGMDSPLALGDTGMPGR